MNSLSYKLQVKFCLLLKISDELLRFCGINTIAIFFLALLKVCIRMLASLEYLDTSCRVDNGKLLMHFDSVSNKLFL